MRLEQCQDYTRHRCDISVPEATQPSSITVFVRPKAQEKLIKTSENSEWGTPGSGSGGCQEDVHVCVDYRNIVTYES